MSSGHIGFEHTALLDSSGAVWTVGSGRYGQLGHGNWNDIVTPTRVEGLPPCAVVAAGEYFTACVDRDGAVFCFGRNDGGQLGQGHTTNLNTPHQVEGLPPIRMLACSQSSVVCIDVDSFLWSFGINNKGQLGLGHTHPVHTPARVDGIRARQVACGPTHTMVLSTDGTLYECGNNDLGRLFAGDQAAEQALSLVPLPAPCQVDSVYCGCYFSLLRATDGTLWIYGQNSDGQLGLGGRRPRQRFTQLPDLVSTQVACGIWHVLCIDDQARLWGWGAARNGQLSPLEFRTTRPTILRTDAKLVLAGALHTLVVTHDDEVWACGHNATGGLATTPTCFKNHWIRTSITADMIQPIGRAPPKRLKSARSAIHS